MCPRLLPKFYGNLVEARERKTQNLVYFSPMIYYWTLTLKGIKLADVVTIWLDRKEYYHCLSTAVKRSLSNPSMILPSLTSKPVHLFIFHLVFSATYVTYWETNKQPFTPSVSFSFCTIHLHLGHLTTFMIMVCL